MVDVHIELQTRETFDYVRKVMVMQTILLHRTRTVSRENYSTRGTKPKGAPCLLSVGTRSTLLLNF